MQEAQSKIDNKADSVYLKTDKQVKFYISLGSLAHFNLLYDFNFDKVKLYLTGEERKAQ